jgi:hypothetical protein
MEKRVCEPVFDSILVRPYLNHHLVSDTVYNVDLDPDLNNKSRLKAMEII